MTDSISPMGPISPISPIGPIARCEPLPVRMVNEYAYCPRLFHLIAEARIVAQRAEPRPILMCRLMRCVGWSDVLIPVPILRNSWG